MGKILNILLLIIIRPLEILFECIFSVADRHLPNPGFTLVFLSLAVSFLCLPLYLRADKIQKDYGDLMKTLQPRIDQIKKTFKGDERVMVLQAYYREKNYSPVMSLRGSVSLLLQIPFFISMYRLISSLPVLEGVSFGPIQDLSRPDGMISLGGLAVNLLPVLMTAINVVSSIIYGRGKKFSEQWQTYLLAAVFLVLLYTSPSGLVLYWTCNNIFSLIKNAVQGVLAKKTGPVRKETAALKKDPVTDRLFIWCGLFLSLFTGFYIPSSVMMASPLEFVNLYTLSGPGGYVVTAFFTAFGFCFFWTGVYYLVLGKRYRRIIAGIMAFMSLAAIVNWFLFDKEEGTMSSVLQYAHSPSYRVSDMIVNLAAVILAGVLVAVILKYKKRILNYVMAVILCGIGMISLLNGIFLISYTTEEFKGRDNDEVSWTLSSTGRNVVIIMMDRAVSAQFPYILDEMPELQDSYDGFTYYPNTISYGGYTNFATPSLFGGYEYTPENLNARAGESIPEKHQEAIKILPILFSENGFRSYWANPVYAGYQYIPVLSEFDDHPEITVFNTLSKFNTMRDEMAALQSNARDRNFFLFSFFRTSPLLLRNFIYDNGLYNASVAESSEFITIPQTRYGDMLHATGINPLFEDSYSALLAMDDITDITDDINGSFIIFDNDTAHEETMLSLPDYTVAQNIDNTPYAEYCGDRELNGRIMHIPDDFTLIHYQVNAAAVRGMAEWLDWLKEQGLYDNTRIIIVSDHGRDLHQFDDMIFGDLDVEHVNPLLLVKDFDSHGFTVSDEFMTNADVPYIAMDGLIDNPVNPFTGNIMTDDAKYTGEQHILLSDIMSIEENNGNTFLPGPWYAFTGDDIFDADNWEYLGEY